LQHGKSSAIGFACAFNATCGSVRLFQLYSREKERELLQNMSDRALKERIIGAVVLVVFAVLVVPVFLDGPSEDEEIISESVTLPGQNNQERQQQTITLDRDRSEPVPATRTPPQATARQAEPATSQPADLPKQEAKPQPKIVEVAEEKPVPPPATAKTEAPATSTTGMWAVQLGSFSNQENAEKLAAGLRDQGYAAFLSQLQTGSGALHRVRIGPQKDRDSAEAIAAQLAKSGHTGQVVPHP
jgi:DedD protein